MNQDDQVVLDLASTLVVADCCGERQLQVLQISVGGIFGVVATTEGKDKHWLEEHAALPFVLSASALVGKFRASFHDREKIQLNDHQPSFATNWP